MNVSNVYTAGPSVVEDGVVWKVCNELPPNYQFSNTGLVRKFISQTQSIQVQPSVKNYPVVSIEGKQYPFHRIIASLFVDIPAGLSSAIVVHKDNDITNNSANNLKWTTPGMVRSTKIDLTKRWIICVEKHKLYNSVTCADYALNIPREAIADSLKTGEPVCGLHFILAVPDNSFSEEDATLISYSKVKEILFNSTSIEDYNKVVKQF